MKDRNLVAKVQGCNVMARDWWTQPTAGVQAGHQLVHRVVETQEAGPLGPQPTLKAKPWGMPQTSKAESQGMWQTQEVEPQESQKQRTPRLRAGRDRTAVAAQQGQEMATTAQR